MVSKMEKDTVIILYKKGLSIRKIAADTLLAMNTVKKYIREYLAAESELAAAKDPRPSQNPAPDDGGAEV